MSFLLLLSIASFLAAVFISCDSVKNTSQDVLVDVCHLVAGVVSEDSVVSFPGNYSRSSLLDFFRQKALPNTGDSQYQAGIFHWASSSIQEAACSVEPATASDVGSIVCLLVLFLNALRAHNLRLHQLSAIGHHRVPFAVRSSSSSQIRMSTITIGQRWRTY
jgi:hypothetical protein